MSELKIKAVYRMSGLSELRVFFLYAFVFSLPFDDWKALYLIEGITINKLIGLIYYSLAIISLKSLYSFSKRDFLVLILVGLWFAIVFSGFFSHVIYAYDIDYLTTFLTLIFIFYAISKEISMSSSVRKGIFVSFIYSVFSIFILLQLGFGIQAAADNEMIDSVESLQRVWFFGLNPNSLGSYSVFAILFCLFQIFEPGSRDRKNYIYFLFIVPFVYLIGLSGSAGAFIVLFVSVLSYFLLIKGDLINKVKYLFLGLIASLFMFLYLRDFDYLIDKINSFFSTGNTTGRTDIWYSALKVISDNLLIGLGKKGGELALKVEHGGHHTAHNVFLDVMLWGGLIGVSLFLLFYVMIFIRSIKYRRITMDPSSIVIVIAALLIIVKAGGGFTIKSIWVFLACSTIIAQSQNKRNSLH